MREFEINVRGRAVKRFELSFPDDFQMEQEPSDLVFSASEASFTTPDAVYQNLLMLRGVQQANDQIEYGYVRVRSMKENFVVNAILEGTNNGIGYDVYPKEFYEQGWYTLADSSKPIYIVDGYHTHTLVENVDPDVSNLFSASDILTMGNDRAERYWLLGINGKALCLLNPRRRAFRDEFENPAYEYGKKFRAGLTYAEGLRDLLECVTACELRLYQSADFRNFNLVSQA